jgi:enoyl-[acyl-carrier protein] reductase I
MLQIKDLMKGKRGLIMGVANHHSLGWGIAKLLANQGAELAFTYQAEPLKKRIMPLAESVNSDFVLECDVTNEESLKKVFSDLKNKWDKIDFVVHSIAFADREALKGQYVATSRDNFLQALDISCYSFTAVCRHAAPLMTEGGAFVTMSYYGAEKVIPRYNVMGVAKAALEASVRYIASDLGEQNIRVNAISAGPVKTLAASGISDFKYMQKWNEENSPLKRNITHEEVGKAGLYLLSDLSSGITGEIHYVDGGYNVMGMRSASALDELRQSA